MSRGMPLRKPYTVVLRDWTALHLYVACRYVARCSGSGPARRRGCRSETFCSPAGWPTSRRRTARRSGWSRFSNGNEFSVSPLPGLGSFITPTHPSRLAYARLQGGLNNFAPAALGSSSSTDSFGLREAALVLRLGNVPGYCPGISGGTGCFRFKHGLAHAKRQRSRSLPSHQPFG